MPLAPNDSSAASVVPPLEVTRWRKVEIGIRGTGFVEIVKGVNEGELVVSPATTNIKDGSRVRAVVAEPVAP